MNYLYQITADMYLEACHLAIKNGKKPGDNIEKELMQILKKYNVKRLGATELSKDELIKEYASHDKKVLDVSVDNKGNTQFRVTKKKSES